jgi:hypothetical protein
VRFVTVATVVGCLVLTCGQDLLLGGRRGIVPRYHVVMFFMLELAVVGGLFSVISSWKPSRPFSGNRRSWAPIGVVVIAGCVSVVANFRSSTWWSKAGNVDIRQVAESINSTPGAIVMTDDIGATIDLARYLRPETIIAQTPREALGNPGENSYVVTRDREALRALVSGWQREVHSETANRAVEPRAIRRVAP